MTNFVGRAERRKNKWIITAQPHVMIMLKKLFSGIDKSDVGEVELSDTPANCTNLLWFCQRYPLDIVQRSYMAMQAALQHEREATMAKVLAPDYVPPANTAMALPPRHYQTIGAEFAYHAGGSLNGDDLGVGKAQPLDAKVLTPSGWRLMGDLAVGDQVIDPDGGIGEVVGVFPQGERDVYRVTANDGGSAVSCAEHLWGVYAANDRKRGGKMRVKELRSFMNDLRGKPSKHGWTASKWFLPLCEPIEFGGPTLLPIHPYLMGVLLGDGSMANVGVSITKPDVELFDTIRPLLPVGVHLEQDATDQDTWRLSRDAISGPNPLIDKLRDLDVHGSLAHEKFVPDVYLFATAEERLALVRGLMDTDGEATDQGYAIFNTSSPMLRDAMVWLARSLGGIASISTKEEPKYKYKGEIRTGRTAYQINVRIAVNPFVLTRKAVRWKKPYMAKAIESVEHVGKAETQCIRVSTKRNLYITDDFIVTHNTITAITLISRRECLPAVVVAQTQICRQWGRQLNRFLPGLIVHVAREGKPYDVTLSHYDRSKRQWIHTEREPDVIVLNYHKLGGWAQWIIEQKRANTLIFDECQELRHHGTAKYAAAKAIRESARWCLGLSVGPESTLLLRGGVFGCGWFGTIEEATAIVANARQSSFRDGVELFDVALDGIETRGWNGHGFAWKLVKKFIKHDCTKSTRELVISGTKVVATDDHSIYVANKHCLTEKQSCNVERGDVVPTDDGGNWNELEESLVDVFPLVADIRKAQVAIDLASIKREMIGVNSWQWKNFHSSSYGTRLPIKTYIQYQEKLPHPKRIYSGNGSHGVGGEPSYIAPTIRLSDWAYVLGFYLGDGWIDKKSQRVAFAVEDARVDEFAQILSDLPNVNLAPSVRRMRGKSKEVRCSHTLFVRVIHHVLGKQRCWSKTIPGEWLTSWSKAARLELLRGLVDSDGHTAHRKRNRKIRWFTTTSWQLAASVQMLLRTLGIQGGLHKRNTKPDSGGIVEGRKIKGKRPTYTVYWSYHAEQGMNEGHHGARRKLAWSTNSFNEGVVRSVKQTEPPSFVYDLEMDGHPSFTANGALVHNSATPTVNLGGEIWAVVDVIRPGALGEREEFGREWCTVAGSTDDGPKYAIKDPDAMGTYLRTSGIMLRRTRKEIGNELPPLQRVIQVVDTDNEALADVAASAVELAKTILSTTGAGLHKMKASAELDWRLRQATGLAKAPHVAHFVRMIVEQGEPVILTGWHRAVYEMWLRLFTDEKLGNLKPAFITGEESEKQKDDAVQKFRNGDTNLLILSLRSGAGLDGLQDRCNIIVHGELDWSPKIMDQVDGRAHRDGQKRSVTAYYLVSEDGSDPVIMDVLGIKEAQCEGIRNPGADVAKPLGQADPAHVRKLAEAYLRKYAERQQTT